MAKRQRIHATELGHMLDRPDRPVYVLDDERTVVFCNKACRQWLGPAADELPGRRCDYHSSPDVTGPDAVAAALCPPPGVFRGQESVASVCRVDETGRAAFRRARFIPLGPAPDEVIGVVAILDAEDLPERPPSPAPSPSPPEAESGTESARLRELLQRFRRQTVALFGIDRLVGNSPAMRRPGAGRVGRRQPGERAVGGTARQRTAADGQGHPLRHGGGDGRHDGAVGLALLGPELIRSAVNAVAAMNRPGEQAAAHTFLFLQADQVAVENCRRTWPRCCRPVRRSCG